MNATLYRELSDSSYQVFIEAGKPIYSSFDIDWKDRIILVNGKEVSPDYVAQEGDIIAIRSIPSGIVAAVVGFTIVATAIGFGVGDQMRRHYEFMMGMVDDQVNRALINAKEEIKIRYKKQKPTDRWNY